MVQGYVVFVVFEAIRRSRTRIADESSDLSAFGHYIIVVRSPQ